MTTIERMTLEDLQKLIDARIDQRLKELFGEAEVDENDFLPPAPPDNRTYEEVLASIERNRWTPPPGAKTSLELLREDRDG